uniref:Pco139614b n=1 Tax=Arundo donax TaxID=35708 RepID=A0A0A9I498_ARUDO
MRSTIWSSSSSSRSPIGAGPAPNPSRMDLARTQTLGLR